MDDQNPIIVELVKTVKIFLDVMGSGLGDSLKDYTTICKLLYMDADYRNYVSRRGRPYGYFSKKKFVARAKDFLSRNKDK